MTKSTRLVKSERAFRILDSAAELVLRWGYDKTTVDDVARHAGVAKGTIYLHWSNREALFAALLRRERVTMLTEVRQAFETTGGTLHDLVRCLALGLLRRPLMKASLLGDSQVLGRLIQQKRNLASAAPEGVADFFERLAKTGATRPDVTPAEQLTVFISALYGFLLVPPMLGDERIPDERLADLVAESVHRTLAPNPPASSDEAARAATDLLDYGLEIAERKLHESLGGPR